MAAADGKMTPGAATATKTPVTSAGGSNGTSKSSASRDYAGFVAGVFSGMAKLGGEYRSAPCLNPARSAREMS